MIWILINFDVDDFFLHELLSLIWIMIIFDVDYGDLCRSFCLCYVYFVS